MFRGAFSDHLQLGAVSQSTIRNQFEASDNHEIFARGNSVYSQLNSLLPPSHKEYTFKYFEKVKLF